MKYFKNFNQNFGAQSRDVDVEAQVLNKRISKFTSQQSETSKINSFEMNYENNIYSSGNGGYRGGK